MGGQGSGRPPGLGRETVEAYRAIDVNDLRRGGWLRPGRQSFLTWTCDGRETGKIQLLAHRDRLQLFYRTWTGEDGWEDIDEVVSIEHVSCHLGGSRPLFICPGRVNGVPCGRRAVKLYGAGRYFLCRSCYRLPYACQREQLWDRKARSAGKIRRRLGGEPGIYCSFPEKPKGMWWRTYDSLADQAFEAAAAAEAAILGRR